MSGTRIALPVTILAALALVSCSMQQEAFELAFESPSETTYTNSTVELAVATADQPFERIELVRGDTVIAELVGSTTHTWDTSDVNEGSYEVTARAYRGDTVAEAGPVTVVVDRTAPSISDTTPANGDENVATDGSISITFSEAIDPDSISGDSLVLARDGGVNVAASRTVSQNGESVTMTILGRPELPVELVASASNTIRDRAGNQLESGTTWNWKVPGWLPVGGPAEIESNHRSYGPSLAFDSAGTAYVAYYEHVDSDFRIYVSRWDGSAWAQVGGAVSTTTAGVDSYYPSLAIDNADRPVVAYEERWSSSDERIFVKRLESGSWSQLGSAVDSSQYAFRPDLAIDQNGLPVVAWVENNGSYDEVRVKRWTGTSFTGVGGALNIGADNADEPDVEINSDHEITVAWEEYDGSDYNIYYAYWDPNADFGSGAWVPQPQDFTDNAEPLDRVQSNNVNAPSMTPVPEDDTPYVAWDEVGEIYVGRPWNYTYYEGDSILNVDPSRYADSVRTALDSQGRLLVAWAESGLSGDDDLYVKRFENNFTLLGGAVYEGPYSGEEPSLALAPDDRPYVAYEVYSKATQSFDIRVVRYNGWE